MEVEVEVEVEVEGGRVVAASELGARSLQAT